MYINSSIESLSIYEKQNLSTTDNKFTKDKSTDSCSISKDKGDFSIKSLKTSIMKDKTVSFSCPSEFTSKDLNFTNTDQKQLSEKINNILDVVSNLESNSEIKEFLSKVKPGYELTESDYKLLDKFNTEVKEKLSSSSESLDVNDKEMLETFSNSFDELITYKKEMEVAYSSYIQAKERTDGDVLQLTKALDNTLNKLKSNGIEPAMLEEMMKKRIEVGVSVKELNSIQNGSISPEKVKEITDKFAKVGVSKEQINKFLSNYKEVLMAGLLKTTLENYKAESAKAGNEPNTALALYQVYVQKFIGTLGGVNKTSPEDLYEVMVQYDKLGEDIKEVNNSNISDDEKKEKLKTLVSEYTKNNQNQTELITSLIDKEFSSDLDVSKAVDVLGGAINSLSKSKKINFINGISKNDLEIAKTATPESYNFIKNDENLSSSIQKFNSGLSNLTDKSNLFVNKKIRFQKKSEAIRTAIQNISTKCLLDLSKTEKNIDLSKENELSINLDEFNQLGKTKENIKEEKSIPLVNKSTKKSSEEFNELKNTNIQDKNRKKLESDIITNSFIRNTSDKLKEQEKIEANKEHAEFTQKLNSARRQINSK